MTFLGVVFTLAGLGCFLWRRSYLLPLLIMASVFEAGAIFNGELGDFSFGVQPFYLVEIFIFLHLVLRFLGQRKLLPPKNVRVRGIVIALCVFWLWCFLSAFIMPRVFAGTLVLSNRNELHEFVPLQWTLSNLAQAGYLTLNIAIVIYAVQVVRTRAQAEQLMKAFYWGAVIVVVIGFAEFMADRAGWDFPYELFNNNSGYAQGFEQEIDSVHRVNSVYGALNGRLVSCRCQLWDARRFFQRWTAKALAAGASRSFRRAGSHDFDHRFCDPRDRSVPAIPVFPSISQT